MSSYLQQMQRKKFKYLIPKRDFTETYVNYTRLSWIPYAMETRLTFTSICKLCDILLLYQINILKDIAEIVEQG